MRGYNTAGDRGIRREVVEKGVFHPSDGMAEQIGRRGAARKKQEEVKGSTLTSSTVIGRGGRSPGVPVAIIYRLREEARKTLVLGERRSAVMCTREIRVGAVPVSTN